MRRLAQAFNEAEMTRTLQSLLSEGETVESAVYCIYKATGFWASNRSIITGYAAITDRDRLIGWKEGLLSESAFALELKELQKVRISGTLFGQKKIHLIFFAEKKKEVKFQAAFRVYGGRFPEQENNLKLLLERLEEKRAALPY